MSFFQPFGAQQQKPATSLFGGFGQQQNNGQQQQQQQPQQNQQQPAAGSSLFGGQTQGSSLFGGNTNATNAPQQPQPTTSLFGNTQQNQPSSGLFGNTATQGQQQQQQEQPGQTTGLFGQPAAGGSTLFGASTNTNANSNQPAPGTSLFGANNAYANNNQTQGGGLFGASQPAMNTFGGFGTSTTTQPASTAVPSLFGQPAANQSVLQQSTALNTAALFTRTTKFNDLPEEIRKKFEQIDTHIQGRVQISDELKQYKLGDEPQKGADQIRVVHKELVNSINKLRVDIASMRELRVQMDQAIQDTIAATRIVDAFRSPQAGQQSVWLKNYANFPLEFFGRVTEQLRERLQWFSSSLEQIERKLASEASHVAVTPQSITSTLQAQYTSFVALASKAAALDSELSRLKETYRALWRAHTGSARDPFSAVDRGSMASGEFGLDGLTT